LDGMAMRYLNPSDQERPDVESRTRSAPDDPLVSF
jgi:hypothetical protein